MAALMTHDEPSGLAGEESLFKYGRGLTLSINLQPIRVALALSSLFGNLSGNNVF